MKFATAKLPPTLKNSSAQIAAWLLAVILLGMGLMQLVRFENFIPYIESYMLPGGEAIGQVVAAVIVTANVFALPFLLRMKLSPLMRIMSMLCGWLVALLWLFLAIWAVTQNPSITSTGHFGSIIKTAPGEWAVWFGVGLVVLTACVTYWLNGDIAFSRKHK